MRRRATEALLGDLRSRTSVLDNSGRHFSPRLRFTVRSFAIPQQGRGEQKHNFFLFLRVSRFWQNLHFPFLFFVFFSDFSISVAFFFVYEKFHILIPIFTWLGFFLHFLHLFWSSFLQPKSLRPGGAPCKFAFFCYFHFRFFFGIAFFEGRCVTPWPQRCRIL